MAKAGPVKYVAVPWAEWVGVAQSLGNDGEKLDFFLNIDDLTQDRLKAERYNIQCKPEETFPLTYILGPYSGYLFIGIKVILSN